MATIGFLHTSEIHVPTFRDLTETLLPGVNGLHVVEPSLLATAAADGSLPPAASELLRRRLDELAEAGADVVLCTCSTIGGHAETAGALVPVVRIDRPAAEAAVAAGTRVAIVAAAESTMQPSLAVFREVARPSTVLLPSLCPGAWDLFLAGDLDGYVAAIAAHCRVVAPAADVIALAQASMAPAAALLTDLPIPVLTSPRAAVESFKPSFPYGRPPRL